MVNIKRLGIEIIIRRKNKIIMVYLYLCEACKRGDHEHCNKGIPAPKGMYGGSKCKCFDQSHLRDNSAEIEFEKQLPPYAADSLNKNFWKLF